MLSEDKEVKEISVDTKKIKIRLIELGLTQQDIAKFLDLATPTINQKINNVRPMTLLEAEKIAVLLKITKQEFCDFFYQNGIGGKDGKDKNL